MGVFLWDHLDQDQSSRITQLMRIKENNESNLVTDSSVPLIHHDRSDLGSLILILVIPKKRTQKLSSLSALCCLSPSKKARQTRSCRLAIKDNQSLCLYILINI